MSATLSYTTVHALEMAAFAPRMTVTAVPEGKAGNAAFRRKLGRVLKSESAMPWPGTKNKETTRGVEVRFYKS